jgi:hypothetical protein
MVFEIVAHFMGVFQDRLHVVLIRVRVKVAAIVGIDGALLVSWLIVPAER